MRWKIEWPRYKLRTTVNHVRKDCLSNLLTVDPVKVTLMMSVVQSYPDTMVTDIKIMKSCLKVILDIPCFNHRQIATSVVAVVPCSVPVIFPVSYKLIANFVENEVRIAAVYIRAVVGWIFHRKTVDLRKN